MFGYTVDRRGGRESGWQSGCLGTRLIVGAGGRAGRRAVDRAVDGREVDRIPVGWDGGGWGNNG
jgi:hypothetical protein